MMNIFTIDIRRPNDADFRYISLMKLDAAQLVGDYIDPIETMTQCCCGELSQWVTYLQQPEYTQIICATCRADDHSLLKTLQRKKRIFFDAEYKPLHAIYVRNEEHEKTISAIKR